MLECLECGCEFMYEDEVCPDCGSDNYLEKDEEEMEEVEEN